MNTRGGPGTGKNKLSAILPGRSLELNDWLFLLLTTSFRYCFAYVSCVVSGGVMVAGKIVYFVRDNFKQKF